MHMEKMQCRQNDNIIRKYFHNKAIFSVKFPIFSREFPKLSLLFYIQLQQNVYITFIIGKVMEI